MIIEDNIIRTETGTNFLRISDNEIFGNEVTLGKTFYLKGEYIEEGILEYPEDYKEVIIINNIPINPSTDYDTLVSDLIHSKYPLNQEIALINNYLEEKESYLLEYLEYLKWRKECKQSVKLYLNITDTNENNSN